ncbi:hypothetical protein J4558_02870 [Leptolyngbya sp. 15MV]|nr:hypothetical protein J4558_02870 [Leptolyngbya sp. 15MV]
MDNRFWRLDARPEGDRFEQALRLVEAPLADPTDGQVVIRNQLLSMDAGTRMWMTDRTDGYQPPLDLGVPMMGLVVGRVVASRHADFPARERERTRQVADRQHQRMAQPLAPEAARQVVVLPQRPRRDQRRFAFAAFEQGSDIGQPVERAGQERRIRPRAPDRILPVHRHHQRSCRLPHRHASRAPLAMPVGLCERQAIRRMTTTRSRT